MYECAELFCVLTNVSNKFVFRRFPLRGGGSSPINPPLACAPDPNNKQKPDITNKNTGKYHANMASQTE